MRRESVVISGGVSGEEGARRWTVVCASVQNLANISLEVRLGETMGPRGNKSVGKWNDEGGNGG